MSLVNYSTDGAVGLLELNRPPVNALNSELALDISAGLTEAADPAIRALVITGAGKHFAAGAKAPRDATAPHAEPNRVAGQTDEEVRDVEDQT